MSFAANAIITDTREAWDYLMATVDERAEFDADMINWINGMSTMLENECNRKIVSRTYTAELQDGNGRPWLIVEQYPITSISALLIKDSTGSTISTVDVSTQLVIDNKRGRIQLTPEAGSFIKGFQNISITYIAGFSGDGLEPFKNAIKEMLSIIWQERGENPTVFVRSQNINVSTSNTKFDPRRLSHIIQRIVYMYRDVEV